jgi:putative OPT family oligopeptide transporter
MASYQPYVPVAQSPAELTPRSLALGAILGLIFGASSVYLALKIGLTVSASIPIAVLSITIFRALGKATILENNITQTVGSAGESIAAGTVFTIPAILLMGYDLDIGRVTVLALVGGVLGILMMIPLRRALIVKEHGNLTYPEGTACAEVLIAGDKGGIHAKTVFQAFGIAFAFKFLMTGLQLWREYPFYIAKWFKGAEVRMDMGPELMGVGYIIGPRIAGYLFAGGTLAYLVLMPAIKLFGEAMPDPMYPATTLIRDMSAAEIRANYVFYIGAGAVATGGIIALVRALPTIVNAFAAGFADLTQSRRGAAVGRLRTDDDLPIAYAAIGALALAFAMTLIPKVGVNLLGALLIVGFGFFFTTVSSRICGQIGSSANPISGMTIAALIGTASIFLLLGWTGIDYRVQAISIAAIIAVAAANAGATSQDLKTGFLVGATPRRQQIGIIVGAVTSAVVVGWTLTLLNKAYQYPVPERHAGFVAPASGATPDGHVVVLPETMSGFLIAGDREKIDTGTYQVARVFVETQGVPPGKYLVDPATHEIRYVVDPGIGGRIREYEGRSLTRLDSPKATLMGLITDGILTHRLPWALVLIGVFISIAIELMGIQSLPVAVGVYLPLSTSSGMFVGGVIRWLVERRGKSEQRSLAEIESGPGVLFSSGLIAGGAIAGIVVAGIAGWKGSAEWLAGSLGLATALGGFATSHVVPLLLLSALGVLLYRVALRKE